jgi:hypothetical protein
MTLDVADVAKQVVVSDGHLHCALNTVSVVFRERTDNYADSQSNRYTLCMQVLRTHIHISLGLQQVIVQ